MEGMTLWIEVTHGGQGENDVIVTGKEKAREKRDEHLRDPPVVLGKHRTRLYP